VAVLGVRPGEGLLPQALHPAGNRTSTGHRLEPLHRQVVGTAATQEVALVNGG
jgi:hypothetical protein